MNLMLNFSVQLIRRYILIELMYYITSYTHIHVIIMFPLLYFDITFVLNKQILTGTTPLKQTFQKFFHFIIFTPRMRRRSKQRYY